MVLLIPVLPVSEFFSLVWGLLVMFSDVYLIVLFRQMNLCQLITTPCLTLIFALVAVSHSISVWFLSGKHISSSTAQNCSLYFSLIFHDLFHLEAR